jgi:hypothetical protein
MSWVNKRVLEAFKNERVNENERENKLRKLLPYTFGNISSSSEVRIRIKKLSNV